MAVSRKHAGATKTAAELLYLDLIKKCLTRYGFGESYGRIDPPKGTLKRSLYLPIKRALSLVGLQLQKKVAFDPEARAEGRDYPPEAETMIGLKRLDNLQECITDVLVRGVPGDLAETGVWRGGASIFMRAILEAYGDTDRVVWAADSFQGLPKPDAAAYPTDAGDFLWSYPTLAVSLDEVKANFDKYGLLDERVRFLPGWFKDTLPNCPIERLAVLRLDGDMYESTMDALRHLYPKLSVGGYLIVDDWQLPRCRAAVEDYRAENNIEEEIVPVDWSAVYWRRQR